MAQVDVEAGAIGRNRPADVAVIGDARRPPRARDRARARAATRAPACARPSSRGQIARRRWRDEPYEDASTDEWIDPRTFSIALNEALPADRAVAVDPATSSATPRCTSTSRTPAAWVFANGFQAVGLGLGNAIGAAVARPDRVTVAAIGDGGAFMALPELETAARLHLGNLLVVIYDDAAYGAEVHHFAPIGHDVSLVRFPDADLAAIAHAAGAKAATVRSVGDLEIVGEWLEERWGHPLVLDAKVNPTICAEWLEEAFRAG